MHMFPGRSKLNCIKKEMDLPGLKWFSKSIRSGQCFRGSNSKPLSNRLTSSHSILKIIRLRSSRFSRFHLRTSRFDVVFLVFDVVFLVFAGCFCRADNFVYLVYQQLQDVIMNSKIEYTKPPRNMLSSSVRNPEAKRQFYLNLAPYILRYSMQSGADLDSILKIVEKIWKASK